MSELCKPRDQYLARALKTEPMKRFETHVRQCTECTREIAIWRSFGSALEKQLEPIRRPPTRTEVAQLLALADEPPATRFGWLVPTFTLAAMAVAVAVVVGFGLTGQSAGGEQPWVPTVVASNGLSAQAGDYATEAQGRALLRLGEDEVGLGPSTSVSIARASAKGTVLRLSRGVVAAQVNPARGKRNFDIETPLGRVHVVGTVFRVRSNEDVLDVDVIRGVVEVEGRSGVPTRVPAGRSLRLTRALATTLSVFEQRDFSELGLEPAAEVVRPPKPEPETELEPVVERVAPTVEPKRVAPVAAWRTAAARGDCKSVIQAAERFIQRDPSDAEAWLVLGDCRRREHQFERAVSAYLAASKTKRPQKNALLQAAELLQQELRRPQQAIGVIDSYLKTKPERGLEAAALVRKARALSALGRKTEARSVLDETVRRLPDTASAAEAVRLREAL